MGNVTLSPEQIALLESSFNRVKAEGVTFATSFYASLFEQHPEIAPLFGHADMRTQASKLLSAMNTIVNSFKDPDTLRGYLGALGLRHERRFMVKERDFIGFREVLIETLSEFEGDDWTDELGEVWTLAFDEIARVMTGH